MKDLSLLLPGPNQHDASFWATVTNVAPLRIRLDGETTALAMTPSTLVAGLIVGDRVWVTFAINAEPDFTGRRAIVLGVAGGTPVGRGYTYHVSTLGAAGVVGTATGAETVIWSPADTHEVLSGRAYRFRCRGELDSAGITQMAHIRLRRTDIGGAVAVAVSREVPAGGGNISFDNSIIFVRNGVDLPLETWVLTLAGGSVPDPIRMITDVGEARRAEITVEDVGAAADFPNAPVWS